MEFPFKLSSTTSSNYSDAEALFRDLKNRDAKIQHLWSHQADIIRNYHKFVDKSDIALELPTGAGKTLVGLLIGEWRRINNKERILYLCPTRQLAFQVNQKASEYGIKAYAFTGKQKDYPPDHFSAYLSSNAIAITTYSSLFNTKPKLRNPDIIILDDAHAGENFIIQMWSLLISRKDYLSQFNQIVNMFADDIPEHFLQTLRDENPEPMRRQIVDLLPGIRLYPKIASLRDLLDIILKNNTDLNFSWQMIRDHLKACNIFFSWSEILIRPWFAPSLTHNPFAEAKQRIYMSATLGSGGELERITGIPKIARIPMPQGWEKQSNGRRLFIYPDRIFSINDYEGWIFKILNQHERSLVLTPNNISVSTFVDLSKKYGLTHKMLGANDIEESLDSFTKSRRSILIMANRYDGIDLAGDACRILVIYGLPSSVNLLERFLWSRLKLSYVLNDRIRTRITQAVGRCTRSSTDYAAVVLVGTELLDFTIKRENKIHFHPELRAEMEFGFDNSEVDDINSLTTLLDIFLNKDDSWLNAEADITKRRDESLIRETKSHIEILQDVVRLEIDCLYDLWRDDFNSALIKATSIIDKLSGDALAGYRALWNYFAGCICYQLSEINKDDKLVRTASDRFNRASKLAISIPWFSRLSNELSSETTSVAQETDLLLYSSENLNDYFQKLGTVGTKFERRMSDIYEGLHDTDPNKFDPSLSDLGKMLGFESSRPDGTGTPDCFWRIFTNYVLLFECKSSEESDNAISIRTCRQAQGHNKWCSTQQFFTQNAKIITIIVSPRRILDKNAIPHASELYYCHLDDIRALYNQALSMLRGVRSRITDLESNERIEVLRAELKKHNLSPYNIIDMLTSKKLIDIDSE